MMHGRCRIGKEVLFDDDDLLGCEKGSLVPVGSRSLPNTRGCGGGGGTRDEVVARDEINSSGKAFCD